MKPKKINHSQGLLFQTRLSKILNSQENLYKLALAIDWDPLELKFEGLFTDNGGAPAKPVRLVISIMMLQNMFNLSDEAVVYQWTQNPYYQFFSGCDYFQWDPPIDPSSLTRWRKRLGEDGMNTLLSSTIKTAISTKTVKKSSLNKSIVDTTVMPKNITFPTDSKLYLRAIESLVKLAKKHDVPLRQSFSRIAKRKAVMYARYRNARQGKRANKAKRKLKTYLGRVYRDIKRKISGQHFLEGIFNDLLETVEKVLGQVRDSKNKIYSIHAPEVECICKGKIHKKYEFGCKVSIVITHKEGLVLNSEALHGNPFDGHTLKESLINAEINSGVEIDTAYVDKGYKGHKIENKKVYMSGQKRGITRTIKKHLNRRQAIEPHIGHMKSDGKLDRNFLKGEIGDKINALLCGVGHNLRMILSQLKQTSGERLLA